MGLTPHYGLRTIDGSGDRFSDNDYQYTSADRRAIDLKLYLGAEAHKHTGAGIDLFDPVSAPLLTLSSTGGVLPGGVTVRYRYTWISLEGEETAASPEASVTTPEKVATPGLPGLVQSTTGGSLLSGSYYYLLSAWEGVATQETLPTQRVYTVIPRGVNTAQIVLELPPLPVGADGFNVYRKGPGDSQYFLLDTIEMGATPSDSYVDTGLVEPDCNRIPPRQNTTGSASSVTVSLPEAVPADAVGWRLYRTFNVGAWDSTLLSTVVEETSEGSGVITTEFLDVGSTTSPGRFPERSQVTASPSKIELTDMAHVQGSLPPGAVYIPVTATFTFAGQLSPEWGAFRWPFPFTEGRVEKVVATLGDGFSPAADPVLVDIRKWDGNAATPSWGTILDGYVTIEVGEGEGVYEVGAEYDVPEIYAGDMLSCDIVQSGGGATPTDADLTVVVVMWVKHGSPTTSFDW